MSVVVVQVGQCGNQVGTQFFKTVIEDNMDLPSNCSNKINESYKQTALDRFFTENKKGEYEARAVMIDMEEKVVQQLKTKVSKAGMWKYNSNCSYCHKKGSGNNWAQGYIEHGPKMESGIEELVRRQAEQCNRLDGLIVTMSLAGGTGSGVGTRVARFLGDHYASSNHLGLAVMPYSRGEVSVQSYNAILSLSHLVGPQGSLGGLILQDNDTLNEVCSRRLGIAKVGMDHLNALIAHQLVGLVQPVSEHRNPISALLSALCCHPDYRVIQMRCLPYMQDKCREFSTHTWPQLIKHLRQMLLSDAPMEEGLDWSLEVHSRRATYVANQIVLRGVGSGLVDTTGLQDARLYANWMPSEDRLSILHQDRPFRHFDQTLFAATNGQGCVLPIEQSVSRGWRMFASKAFLYQYANHGIDQAHMLDSFAGVEQLLSNYKSLSIS